MSDSRFIFRAVIALAAVLLCTVLLLVVVWKKADDANSRVQADVANVKALTAGLKKSVQSPTHGKDIAIWCDAINASRTYQRQYQKGTVQQSEAEARTIEKAIAAPNAHGLTAEQAAFIRQYLDSVVALDREVPKVLSLHPFTLADLNCSQIEAQAGEAASIHTKP